MSPSYGAPHPGERRSSNQVLDAGEEDGDDTSHPALLGAGRQKGGDEIRFGPVSCEGHAEVVRRPRKTPDSNASANYNPVAEAEAILASEALQVAA